MNTRVFTVNTRAFTLIETLLAATLGAIVVAVGIGIFAAVARADGSLSVRAEEQSELNKLHLVMQRTFSTLLVSNAPAPPRETARAEPVESAGQSPTSRRTRESVFVPARFALQADPRLVGVVLAKSGVAADVSGVDATGVQRLEVTLTDAPISSGFWQAEVEVQERRRRAGAEALRRAQERAERGETGAASGERQAERQESSLESRERERREAAREKTDARREAEDRKGEKASDKASPEAIAATSGAGESAEEEDELAAPLKAVRGVFDLRPMPEIKPGPNGVNVPTGEVARAADGAVIYELWWTPMSPRETGDRAAPEMESVAIGDPVRVASMLRYVRWTMFDNKERKRVLMGARQSELPAYVELEAETVSGLYANWMFEVSWAMGAEVAPRPQREPSDTSGTRATGATEARVSTPIQRNAKEAK